MRIAHLVILLCALSFAGCTSKESQSKVISAYKKLSYVKDITVEGPFEITLVQGGANEMQLEGEQWSLHQIIMETSSGHLKLAPRKHFLRTPLAPIRCKIYVTDDLSSIRLLRGAQLKSRPLKLRSLSLFVAEASLSMEIEANRLITEIDKEGEISLRGSVKNQSVYLYGAGDYDASQLSSLYCDVRIEGKGLVKVRALEDLKMVIFGSGEILYSGNPKEVEEHLSGGGTINPY